MNRQELFSWVKKQYKTEPDHPWMDENTVLRHKENKKWYGLVMEVEKSKLGMDDDSTVDILNVKCEPLLVDSLRTQPGFHPAYHMNKDKWISIRLDGSVPDDEIKNLIALSYELTEAKKKAKTVVNKTK